MRMYTLYICFYEEQLSERNVQTNTQKKKNKQTNKQKKTKKQHVHQQKHLTTALAKSQKGDRTELIISWTIPKDL